MKKLSLILLFCGLAVITNAQTNSTCALEGKKADYLLRIGCPNDFNYLKGRPLTEKFGYAASVKIVYSIAEKTVYFTNSSRFPFHYEFCTNVLGSKEDIQEFNTSNYRVNRNRKYILCNLNYYSQLDVYALELMAEDNTDASQLSHLFQKIASLTYFPSKIKMLVSTSEAEEKLLAIPGLPIVRADEIYKGRQYVSLTKGVAFGYLRKVNKGEVGKMAIGKRDIILMNDLPNELPVVAGVLTVPLQTPLCHISLLCQNRKTPNAVFRSAWEDEKLNYLVNNLVRYEVNADSFSIRPATELEAETFWKKQEKKKVVKLKIDTSIKQLLQVTTLGHRNVSSVGGKAANFAELSKVRLDKQPLNIPECAFAIPFYHYYEHLRNNGLGPLIDSLLKNPNIIGDPIKLSQHLRKIRNAIKDAPINQTLLESVTRQMQLCPSFVNYRFRSSTNAEDIKGFNGAGLYESKTGSLTDPGKPVDKAIKAVWASLWGDRAFIEREYFHIDQRTVAMGILVHRAFGEELSNGVAVTRHLYRKNYPAYTINVQLGEVSVVSPPDSVTCDEAIIGLGEVTGSDDIALEYIGRSSLSKDKPILTIDQIRLLTRYLTAIKKHFYKIEGKLVHDFADFTMDVEFKIDAYSGKLYVKQARVL
jgi:pyruvate,water dikinase